MSDRPSRYNVRIGRAFPALPLAMLHHDAFQPPTDVYETDTEIIVKVDIAGVTEDNMEVMVDEGELRVHGYRTDCSAFSKSAIHRMEIMCGEFDTFVRLPHAVDADAEINCIYRNGMLTITLQKQVARKVQISKE